MEFKFINCLTNVIVLLYIGGSNQQVNNAQLFFIGPGVSKSQSTRPVENIIFLSQDGSAHDGTLAGFAAYLIRDGAVELQIWRPVKTSNTTFTIVASYPFTPPPMFEFPNYQDIYINNLALDCIRIAKGDRVGIFFKSTTWPIPYTFIGDGNPDKQRSYSLNVNGIGELIIGNQYMVDQLVFPSQFSLVAWVVNFTNTPADFNPDVRQTTACPNIIFPPWVATSKPPTTSIPKTPPMGYTGSTGRVGPQGSQGPKGSTGPVGATGPKGSNGAIGLMGAIGDKGEAGMKGGFGLQGLPGVQGQVGDSGVTGVPGLIGVKGEPGKNGSDAFYTGNPSNPDNTALAQVSEWKWWRSRSLIIGLYAWSAILSVLIIAVFVCTVNLLDRVRQEKNK